jgi:hypothetical protein
LELFKSFPKGPWPEEEEEQRLDGHVPARRATGGEVRGEGKLQGLTAVRLDYLSRVGTAEKEDLDGSPKRRGGVNNDGDAPAANVGEGPARKHQ